MACPSCGGQAAVAIMSGVVECVETLFAPTGAHPSGIHGPTVRHVTCGRRYQVPVAGSTLGICGCGMQAIAVCARCANPICLTDLTRVQDRVICAQHLRDEQAAEQARVDREVDAAWRVFVAALDRFQQTGTSVESTHLYRHAVAGRGWNSQAQMVYGNADRAVVRRLRPGAPCPLHPPGTCWVTEVRRNGKVLRRVAAAECDLPLWPITPDHFPTCVDSVGNLFLLTNDIRPVQDVTPSWFAQHAQSLAMPLPEVLLLAAELLRDLDQ
jgi:hypothetical protein